jgi:hypothetical protein
MHYLEALGRTPFDSSWQDQLVLLLQPHLMTLWHDLCTQPLNATTPCSDQPVPLLLLLLLLSPEDAVREMLRDFSVSRGLPEVGTVTAADQLDDGSPIALAITIDR